MSLDQFVACRRAPKLPDDLPGAGAWSAHVVEDVPVYTLTGAGWLVSVSVEPAFPEDMTDQLADDLADTGIADARVEDYGVLVSVMLQPVTQDEDALSAQMAVLDMLVETCDGVVLAN